MIKIMTKNRHKYKSVMTGFAFVVCFLCAVMWTLGLTTKADDSVSDYALSTVSKAATGYLNDTLSPDSDAYDENGIAKADMSTAGGLLGYEDLSEKDTTSWLSHHSSINQVTYSYDMLANIKMYDSAGTSNALLDYARYGYALSAIGFDEVDTEASGGLIRMVIGMLMMALYVLSLALPAFFSLVIDVLKAANPYRLFAGAGTLFSDKIANYATINGKTGTKGSIATALSTLADHVTSFYNSLSDLSMVVIIPCFLAVLLITIFLFKKVDKAGAIKRYVVRITFVVIGVPLMFAFYTEILNKLGNSVGISNSASTHIVASTFLDFESWVVDSKLDMPSDKTLTLTVTNNSENPYTGDIQSGTDVRSLCYAINKSSGAIESNEYDKTTGTQDASKNDTQWDTNMMVASNETAGKNLSVETVTNVMNVLQRYTKGTKYHASDYESIVTKKLMAKMKTKEDRDAVNQFFVDSVTKDKYVIGEDEKGSSHKDGAPANRFVKDNNWKTSEGGVNLFADGNMNTVSGSNKNDDCVGDITFKPSGNSFLSRLFSSRQFNSGGLSSMAMYNYLNTEFTASNINVYSPTASASNYTRKSHYSVNSVGQGVMKWLYLFDALVLMAAASVVGYFYGFAMIFASFKNMFKLIPSVFGGMFGSIKSIASAIVITIALLVEIIGTMLLYAIVNDILFVFTDVIEVPFQSILSKNDTTSTIFAAVTAVSQPVVCLVSIVALVIFIKYALKMRRVIVRTFNEAATATINKFLGTNAVAPSTQTGSGVAGKLKSAAMIGGGMAMAAGSGALNGLSANPDNPFGVKGGVGSENAVDGDVTGGESVSGDESTNNYSGDEVSGDTTDNTNDVNERESSADDYASKYLAENDTGESPTQENRSLERNVDNDGVTAHDVTSDSHRLSEEEGLKTVNATEDGVDDTDKNGVTAKTLSADSSEQYDGTRTVSFDDENAGKFGIKNAISDETKDEIGKQSDQAMKTMDDLSKIIASGGKDNAAKDALRDDVTKHGSIHRNASEARKKAREGFTPSGERKVSAVPLSNQKSEKQRGPKNYQYMNGLNQPSNRNSWSNVRSVTPVNQTRTGQSNHNNVATTMSHAGLNTAVSEDRRHNSEEQRRQRQNRRPVVPPNDGPNRGKTV